MTRFLSTLLLASILFALACKKTEPPPEPQPSAAGFDGPAELPRTEMKTSIADTPAANPVKTVAAAANLQTALTSAQCGDHYTVDPKNNYTGSLKLPTRTDCTAANWIVIESAGPLPAEGTRITREQCALLPTITLNGSSASVQGGTYVRLVGFNITRAATLAGNIYNMVFPAANNLKAHHLVFDRVCVHGTPVTETVRGFLLNNITDFALVDSQVFEMHCLALAGTCTDSQALAGGMSQLIQDGNFKIENNGLEAGAETILFGGGGARFTPTDITVRRNTMSKPDSWNRGEPSYQPVKGNAWIVKNLFELKNAQRVLIENNRMENTWGGFSQIGYALLLTPKNQNGQCPVCAVLDVTFRNNHISKAGQAWQLAIAPDGTGQYWAKDGGRWTLRNNLVDGLQYPTCDQCGHWLQQFSSGYTPSNTATPVLHDVTIDANQLQVSPSNLPRPGAGGYGFLLIGGPPANSLGIPQITNFVYTNNVVYSGNYPVWSTGGTASVNCATPNNLVDYAVTWKACFTGNSPFTGNVIMAREAGKNIKWPEGNLVTSTAGPGLKVINAGLPAANVQSSPADYVDEQ
jgi:hypothetical protein